MQTRAAAGSVVGLGMTENGKPKVLGDGSMSVIVAGTVLDDAGNEIGDLHDIVVGAVSAWESLLREYGLSMSTA